MKLYIATLCQFCIFFAFPAIALASSKSAVKSNCLSALEKRDQDILSEARIKYYKKEREALGATAEQQMRYATTKYGSNYGAAALTSLRTLGDKFPGLIVDPGIVFNISGFVEFVQSQKLSRTNPWIARQLYAEQLKFITVYRGLALTKDEYDAIMEKNGSGIESFFIRNKKNHSFQHSFSVVSLSQLVRQRMGTEYRGNDPFLSVTKYPEVAAAVASEWVDNEEQKIYVFKLRIPRLDFLYAEPNNFLDGLRPDENKFYIRYGKDGQSEKSFPVDERLESLIPYVVERGEILSAVVPKVKYLGGIFGD